MALKEEVIPSLVSQGHFPGLGLMVYRSIAFHSILCMNKKDCLWKKSSIIIMQKKFLGDL